MAKRAAHLVDHVFPDVPVRQGGVPAARFLRGGVEWVLSLPHRLRYLLAWDHDPCRAASGVAVRAVLGFLRRRACREGVADGRCGAVVVVQRFGGALNLNIHLHVLVLDGVFTNDGGAVPFHPVRRLTRGDVAAVLALVAQRVTRLVERRGLAASAEDGEASDLWSDEAPVLAAVAAASVEGRVALGPRVGARVRRCGDPPDGVAPATLGPCHAHAAGFDLRAGLVVRDGQRDGEVERLHHATATPLRQTAVKFAVLVKHSQLLRNPGRDWPTGRPRRPWRARLARHQGGAASRLRRSAWAGGNSKASFMSFTLRPGPLSNKRLQPTARMPVATIFLERLR
jgi:hypothetical protein